MEIIMMKLVLTAASMAVAVMVLSAVSARTARAARKPAAGQPPEGAKVEMLWPADTPGIKDAKEQDKPTLMICPAAKDKANGAAVVICPGGGYGGLAMDHEGYQVANWLNSLGVAGFIVKYRHRGNGVGHPAPLDDAQRAIATVRSRAGEWDVDPNRIGILGFSAGGHLASTAGTHFHKGKPDAADPVQRVSCRPDFMILVYPVISFTEPYTHRGSMQNLLGKDPDPNLVEDLSNERRVTSETPPTFLIHSNGDKGVPAENSIAFALALRKAKVPVELHLYEKGNHGFGLGVPGTPPATALWPGVCAEWMRGRGLLAKKTK
jgi:acetyl esterase/lipase